MTKAERGQLVKLGRRLCRRFGSPATDQRGVARPQDGNGDSIAVNDIGAFEVQLWPVFLSMVLRN